MPFKQLATNCRFAKEIRQTLVYISLRLPWCRRKVTLVRLDIVRKPVLYWRTDKGCSGSACPEEAAPRSLVEAIWIHVALGYNRLFSVEGVVNFGAWDYADETRGAVWMLLAREALRA